MRQLHYVQFCKMLNAAVLLCGFCVPFFTSLSLSTHSVMLDIIMHVIVRVHVRSLGSCGSLIFSCTCI